MAAMPITLRLTDAEQAALEARAQVEGISVEEAACRAIRDYLARAGHRDRVEDAAELIGEQHAGALRQLGE